MAARLFLEDGWASGMFKIEFKTASIITMCVTGGPKRDEFWLRCRTILHIFEPVEALRTWAGGCACHEVDREERRRPNCPLAGRRMATAWLRVREFLRRDTHAGLDDLGEISQEVAGEAAAASAVLTGAVHDRTEFLDRLPYKLARLRSPGVAVQVLERFDFMTDSGARHHRVSLFFLSKSSSLRRHIEGLAAGLPMDIELARELMGIEWCLLDEGSVEGEHRDLGLESQRAHAAKHPFSVATVRLKQNRELLARIKGDGALTKLFHRCWGSWKILSELTQLDTFPHVPRQARKRTFKESCNLIYRLGKSSFAEFGNLRGLFRDSERRSQPLAYSNCGRLLSAFLKSALQIGRVYSVPSLPNPVPRPVALIMEELSNPNPVEDQPLYFFRLLGTNMRFKKTIQTHDEDLDTPVTSTVMKVEAFVVSDLDYAPAKHVNLPSVGITNRTDLAVIAPLCSWIRGLRVWTRRGLSGPHIYQHVTYEFPELVQVDGGTLDINLPMAVALFRLSETGWSAGRKVSHPHFPGDKEKRLCLEEGFTERPAYASCLLHLQELFHSGLKSLHTCEANGYYQAILTVIDKSSVLAGKSQSWYTALANGTPLPEGSCPKRRRLFEADDDETPFCAALTKSTKVTRKALTNYSRMDATENSSATDSDSEQDSDSVPRAGTACGKIVPLAQNVPIQESTKPNATDLPDSSASGSCVLRVPDPVPLVVCDAPGLSEQASALRVAAMNPDVPRTVEGVKISLISSSSLSGEYVRKTVRCPNGAHRECHKSRCCTMTRSFGQSEVVGYLGCWLRAANRYPDRESHMKYKPSLEHVRDYLSDL